MLIPFDPNLHRTSSNQSSRSKFADIDHHQVVFPAFLNWQPPWSPFLISSSLGTLVFQPFLNSLCAKVNSSKTIFQLVMSYLVWINLIADEQRIVFLSCLVACLLERYRIRLISTPALQIWTLLIWISQRLSLLICNLFLICCSRFLLIGRVDTALLITRLLVVSF